MTDSEHKAEVELENSAEDSVVEQAKASLEATEEYLKDRVWDEESGTYVLEAVAREARRSEIESNMPDEYPVGMAEEFLQAQERMEDDDEAARGAKTDG